MPKNSIMLGRKRLIPGSEINLFGMVILIVYLKSTPVFVKFDSIMFSTPASWSKEFRMDPCLGCYFCFP